MSTVNLDIENFNQYVKVNVGWLKARGERTDNFIINLFKAYQTASDVEFVEYIKIKRDQYDDGYNISTDELMTSALNKFDILRKDNKRNSMSPKQEQIIALAYVVKKLKEKNLKLSKSFTTSPPIKGKGIGKGKGKGKG